MPWQQKNVVDARSKPNSQSGL